MKKSILITGASTGMGLANTIFFAQNGYQVFATYRLAKDGEKLKQIKNVHPIKMDVTNGDDIQQAFQQVYGILANDGLFAIINNAGIGYSVPFEFADEKRAKEVDMFSYFRVTLNYISEKLPQLELQRKEIGQVHNAILQQIEAEDFHFWPLRIERAEGFFNSLESYKLIAPEQKCYAAFQEGLIRKIR